MLWYKPLPGETIENTRIVAPVLEHFIIIKGEPSSGRFVKNITFSGLTFQHASYYTPESGFEPAQAAAPIDAVVLADGAKNIRIEGCEITQTGSYGIWFRRGCSDCRVEKSHIHDLGAGGFHQHYGRENIIRNNIFAFSKLYQLQCTRVEDHLSFTFSNNIVYFTEGVLFSGPWTDIRVNLFDNIYWNAREPETTFADDAWKEWRKQGLDEGSLIADPLFFDPQMQDFRFKSPEAYKKINFKPFDHFRAGIFGDVDWIGKAALPAAKLRAFNQLFESDNSP